MKTNRVGLCVIAVVPIMILIYSGIQKKIQSLCGTAKVSGDSDTDVVFTDVETGEQYIIGYITHGVTEKIKLERGKWYKVEAVSRCTL